MPKIHLSEFRNTLYARARRKGTPGGAAPLDLRQSAPPLWNPVYPAHAPVGETTIMASLRMGLNRVFHKLTKYPMEGLELVSKFRKMHFRHLSPHVCVDSP